MNNEVINNISENIYGDKLRPNDETKIPAEFLNLFSNTKNNGDVYYSTELVINVKNNIIIQTISIF